MKAKKRKLKKRVRRNARRKHAVIVILTGSDKDLHKRAAEHLRDATLTRKTPKGARAYFKDTW